MAKIIQNELDCDIVREDKSDVECPRRSPDLTPLIFSLGLFKK